MSYQKHYTRLENMYKSAPINKIYPPRIPISEGLAEIEIDVKEEYFHAARAVHGSVYFKLLDDAAFFAACSLETEVFPPTSSFNTYIIRPVNSGVMRAVGKVVNASKTQFIAESIVYNGEDKEIARGSGVFVKSNIKLADIPEYKD